MLIDLRIVELLVARLCHDLIGPAAAIGNGVELLGDDDPDFMQDAIRLVGESSLKVTRRLQFYRFAYGFGGGGLAGPAPDALAAELFADGNVELDYSETARALPLEWQKLACNMLAVGSEALPRGGRLVLTGSTGLIELAAFGDGSGPSPETCAALSLTTPSAELTSRSVGAYFTGLLARSLGCGVAVEHRPGGFRLTADAG